MLNKLEDVYVKPNTNGVIRIEFRTSKYSVELEVDINSSPVDVIRNLKKTVGLFEYREELHNLPKDNFKVGDRVKFLDHRGHNDEKVFGTGTVRKTIPDDSTVMVLHDPHKTINHIRPHFLWDLEKIDSNT
jgi:hypothetical protein